MKKEILSKECEIMGHKIKLENIKNPHIKKAIKNRAGFLFNYGDSSSGKGHTDYTERINEHSEYSERSTHTDCNKSRTYRPSRTIHTDKTYSDHSEYSEHNEYGDYSEWYGNDHHDS